MRMGLACFILCQFMVVGRLSIAVADGPMQHTKSLRFRARCCHSSCPPRRFMAVILCPDLAFGESYMDSDLQIESGKIDDLLALLIANNNQWNRHWIARLMLAFDTRLSRFSTLNFPSRSRRNAAHHYDLKDSLSDTFLDPWRKYSCAYFRSVDEPLADAQITKLARIAAKLRLQPHDKILNIRCGWGGLAFALASVEPGASVTGITLLENQHAYAKTGVEPTPQAKHIH